MIFRKNTNQRQLFEKQGFLFFDLIFFQKLRKGFAPLDQCYENTGGLFPFQLFQSRIRHKDFQRHDSRFSYNKSENKRDSFQQNLLSSIFRVLTLILIQRHSFDSLRIVIVCKCSIILIIVITWHKMKLLAASVCQIF